MADESAYAVMTARDKRMERIEELLIEIRDLLQQYVGRDTDVGDLPVSLADAIRLNAPDDTSGKGD